MQRCFYIHVIIKLKDSYQSDIMQSVISTQIHLIKKALAVSILNATLLNIVRKKHSHNLDYFSRKT